MNKKNKTINAYPTSFMQKRIWFLEKLEKGKIKNNIGVINRFSGAVRTEDVRVIVQKILDRHEICRTNFQETIDGELVQIVHDKASAKFSIFDLRELQAEEKATKEKEIIETETNRSFDLTADQLIRFEYIRLSQDEQILLVVGHHIIFDAWSMSIAANEFFYLAQALFYKQTIFLPPLSVHFKDYANWEQREEFNNKVEKSKKYWLQKLSGELPLLELPLDFPRPKSQSYESSQSELVIDKALKLKLEDLARSFRVTPFVFLLAVYNILLFRLSGQEDLIVGTFVTNRDLPELDNVIGPFLNSIALRSEIDDTQSFSSYLSKVKNTVLSAMENKDYPFENLIEELSPNRDFSRAPIFSTTFQIFNSGGHEDLKSNIFYKHTKEYKTFDKTLGQFDISVHIHNREEDYLLVFIYGQALFKAETIERFLGYFKKLIVSICENPEEKIGRLKMISSEEKYFLSEEFNQTNKKTGTEKNLYQIFAKSADNFPDKIAVRDSSESLTYLQLDEKVNSLACYFSRQGINSGEVVGIALERSNLFLASLLAIAKIGAVFLPLDWSDPRERNGFIINDSGAKFILLEDGYELIDGVLILKRSELNLAKDDNANYSCTVISNFKLAIIYTSGSTGMPKGVSLSHQGIINHAWGKIYFLEAEANDIFVQNLSSGFVASLWQYFSPLFIGASLIIYPDEVAKNTEILIEKLAKDKISIWETSLMIFKKFLEIKPSAENFSSYLKILLTGEDTPDYLVDKYFSFYNFDLYNAYGQTECSDDTLMYKIPQLTPARVLLGNPIINTQAYILNKQLQLSPTNTVGEIYISGDCISEGYLNQADLTAETFLPHPLMPGKVIFKTGDLGRRLSDGNLEYLGRGDKQVKIRGRRLDLKEIESLILNYEKIKDCLVILKKGKLGVFYLAFEKIPAEELREYLKKFLPVYVLPNYYKQLSVFPINSHGKIDTLALPDFHSENLANEQFRAPKTKEEKFLVKIWLELLGDKIIGRDDDFFSLGGHSLKVVRLLSRLREKGYEISMSDIFRFSKLSEMAKQMKKSESRQENNLLTVIGDYLRDKNGLRISEKKLDFNLEKINSKYFSRSVVRLQSNYPDTKINIGEKSDLLLDLIYQDGAYRLKATRQSQKISPILFAKIMIDWQRFYNLTALAIDDNKIFAPFSSYPDYYHCLHINILEMIFHQTGQMISENLPPAYDYFMLPSYLVGEAGMRRDNDFNGFFIEDNELFVGAKKIGLESEIIDLKNEKNAWEFFVEKSKHEPVLLMGNNFYLPASLYYQDKEFIASLLEQRNLLPINFSVFQLIGERIIVSSPNLNFFGEISKNDFISYWRNLKNFPGSKKGNDGLAFRVLELKKIKQLSMSSIDNYYEALGNTVREYFQGMIIDGNKEAGFTKLCLGKSVWAQFLKDINDNVAGTDGAVSDIVIIDMVKRLQKPRLFLHKFLQELSGLNDDFAPETSLTAKIIKQGDVEFERLYKIVKENRIEYEPVLTFLPRLDARKNKFLSQNDKKKLLAHLTEIEIKEKELFLSLKNKLDKIK